MTEIKRIEMSSQSFYDLARNEYKKIIRFLTEHDYKVIYEAPYTYIIKNGKMWFSKCMECDVFSGAEGLFVAFYKMKGWDLPITYKKCKMSDLKSGDKFKLVTYDKYFYTCDVKSYCSNDATYCIFSKDNSTERFYNKIEVFKIS